MKIHAKIRTLWGYTKYPTVSLNFKRLQIYDYLDIVQKQGLTRISFWQGGLTNTGGATARACAGEAVLAGGKTHVRTAAIVASTGGCSRRLPRRIINLLKIKRDSSLFLKEICVPNA